MPRSRNEIVASLAATRRVEEIVAKVAGRFSAFDRDDLSQLIYGYLLEEPGHGGVSLERLQEMDAKGQLPFFVARLALNQVQLNRTAFKKIILADVVQVPIIEDKDTEEDSYD